MLTNWYMWLIKEDFSLFSLKLFITKGYVHKERESKISK